MFCSHLNKKCQILIIGLFSMLATAQAVDKIFLIDFEGIAEGTEISNQYASLGVLFGLPDTLGEYPIISVEGSPRTAFTGSGDDTPMSSGSAGLTDPVVGGDITIAADIGMDFTEPITRIQFYIIDIDGSDVFTANAYYQDLLVDSQTQQHGQSGTGNGVSTLFSLSAESIDKVVIDVSEGSGYAVDFVVFTRPCEGPGCNSLVEVSQESAPDAGDFASHVLGYLTIYQTSASAMEFYAYDVPEGDSWNGSALTPIMDRSHLLVADTSDGTTLFAIHDRAIPDDTDGGKAEMIFTLQNDPNGAFISVKDDPDADENGPYGGDPGDSVFTTDHAWSECCTDGIGKSGLDVNWVMDVVFANTDDNASTPAIQGLTHWMAYSADGSTIPLSLEEGRRVRLQLGSGCLQNYAGDINGDCKVDMKDLVIVARDWLLGT